MDENRQLAEENAELRAKLHAVEQLGKAEAAAPAAAPAVKVESPAPPPPCPRGATPAQPMQTPPGAAALRECSPSRMLFQDEVRAAAKAPELVRDSQDDGSDDYMYYREPSC